MAQLAPPELLVQLDRSARLVLPARPELLAQLVPQERTELLAQQVLLAQPELLAQPVLLAPPVPQEQTEPTELLAPPARPV